MIFPTCLPSVLVRALLVSLLGYSWPATCLGLLWIHLAGGFYTCPFACFPAGILSAGRCYTCLPRCPSLHLSRPTLDTLGRMFLHLSPLASLLAPCLDTLAQMILYTLVSHLSLVSLRVTLVSACLGLLWIHLAGVVSCLSPHYILLALAGSSLVSLLWVESFNIF